MMRALPPHEHGRCAPRIDCCRRRGRNAVRLPGATLKHVGVMA
jgi:hypothetical protein